MTTGDRVATEKTEENAAEASGDRASGDRTGGAVAGKVGERAAPAEKRRALGRGLESLLPGPRPAAVSVSAVTSAASAPGPSAVAGDAPVPGTVDEMQAQAARGTSVVQIRLDQIDHNPYQTRKNFDPELLQELAESIETNGLLQPIVVRPGAEEGRYVLILGERRCRASKIAHSETIPAIVRRVSEQQAAEMTIIENLQRQDLTCIEQANAFQKLSQKFGLTQEEIGERVGMSRESVANYMRILKLPDAVTQYLADGMLEFSHARELLRLDEDDLIEKLAKETVNKKWSLATLQDMVDKLSVKMWEREPEEAARRGARWVDPNVRAAQTSLERTLGMRVRISDRKGKGKITIEYANIDDFDRVLEMLKVKRFG